MDEHINLEGEDILESYKTNETFDEKDKSFDEKEEKILVSKK